MKILWTAAAAALTLGLVSVASAHASSIAVQNSSFETLPATWATDATPCGGSCAYSSGSIPDWSTTGATGQWIVGGYAGNPSATDGDVLAYSNGGSIYQTVGTAVAGTTYTLQVDVLHRTDLPLEGVVELEVGSVIVATAPVVDGGAGTWSDWTAAFTATAADVGQPLTILLSASGGQGDFDNVRLSAQAVPESASWALLLTGFAAVAGATSLVRRRTTGARAAA